MLNKLSLLLLTMQQATMPLLVRYSQVRTAGQALYLASTSVFMMEIIRVAFCSTILTLKHGSPIRFLSALEVAVLGHPKETIKVCIPAVIYALQNNLYYIALANLEATAYSITYQMRTFTTALLSVLMLRKHISPMQWSYLAMSAVGVTIVHLQQTSIGAAKDDHRIPLVNGNPVVGFAAVIGMCWTSAFAGVYFEKVLKGSPVDLWTQNIRLSFMTLPFSGLAMCYTDWDRLQNGVFQGWTWLVWLITLSAALGGFLVSAVMKYADNIQKTYAQSVAIVLTAAGSALFLDFRPTVPGLFGMGLVLASTYLYSFHPLRRRLSLTGDLKSSEV